MGPNGAGKTTLVNILTGFDFPSAGRVELEDRDITTWPPHLRGRAGLARTFQQGHAFRALTVRENVEVAALGVGASAGESRGRATSLLGALGLLPRADDTADALPHGDERKLGVARALATEPRFVLMDEPAAGLTEDEVPELVSVIRSVRDEHGAGVLLIDHNVPLIMEVCDRIHVLDQGRTLAEGTPEEIRRNIDVVNAYLGGSGRREEGKLADV
ncbi:MAG: ABC transporter ATP-binding protein [Gaiellaceae bacterium]